MGYYTYFELEVLKIEDNELVDSYEDVEAHEKAIGEVDDYGNPFEDGCKWYQYEDIMIKHSKRHPDLIFKISGNGEENGDMWNHYFKNGLHQKCKAKIIIEDFDENKLQ